MAFPSSTKRCQPGRLRCSAAILFHDNGFNLRFSSEAEQQWIQHKLMLSERCCVLPVFTNPTTQAALITVHGAWDEWSPWSLCSSTCGRGFRSRTRTCTPPQFGGDPCEGPEKQTKFCNIAVCPGTVHAVL